MKIFNFHLMPYSPVDLDAIEQHGSACRCLHCAGASYSTSVRFPCA